MREMVAGPVEKLQLAEEMFIDLLQVVRAEKNMILATTPDQIAGYDKQIQQSRLDLAAKLDRGISIATVAGKSRWVAIHDGWQQFLGIDDKLRRPGRTW